MIDPPYLEAFDESHLALVGADGLGPGRHVGPPHPERVQGQLLPHDLLLDLDGVGLVVVDEVGVLAELAHPHVLVALVGHALVLEDGVAADAVAVLVELDVADGVALNTCKRDGEKLTLVRFFIATKISPFSW